MGNFSIRLLNYRRIATLTVPVSYFWFCTISLLSQIISEVVADCSHTAHT